MLQKEQKTLRQLSYSLGARPISKACSEQTRVFMLANTQQISNTKLRLSNRNVFWITNTNILSTLSYLYSFSIRELEIIVKCQIRTYFSILMRHIRYNLTYGSILSPLFFASYAVSIKKKASITPIFYTHFPLQI